MGLLPDCPSRMQYLFCSVFAIIIPMAKSISQYVCQQCGARSSRWMGKCEQCGAWNSLVEEIAMSVNRSSKREPSSGLTPTVMGDITAARLPRITSGIAEVDQVLGGGIVPGSVMLLSGDPGIGKSTLVLQIAARLAGSAQVLYVSGEESTSQ